MRLLPSRLHLGFLASGFVLLPVLLASVRGGGEPPAVEVERAEALETLVEVEPLEGLEPEAAAAPLPSHARVPDLRPLRRAATDGAGGTYRPERAAFPVRVGGEVLTRRVTAVAVLPGGTLPIRAVGLAAPAEGRTGGASERPPGPAGDLVLEHADGTVAAGPAGGAGIWEWTAPAEPGIHALRVRSRSGGREVWIHALVMHPRTAVRGQALNGYAIGRYMERPRGGLDAYVPPEGFVEVSREDRDVLVSPHFTLGQFLCKQPGEPRYVAYSLPLVTKLEAVLEELDRTGRGASTLHVMSGFRTPAYNRAIGNTTVYSRHLWGDAADVWVDADGDGEMDDLNGDGRIDLADARALGRVVERVERRGGAGILPGGMGLYRRNAYHGPFVHVDARGHRARW